MAGLWGGVGMSKFGTFGDYPKESLLSAEAALLTAWRSLERYHDDLVLVGGLAVHYLTKREVAGLPGAVTMDVDFGISLAASGEQYGTIKTDLAGLGFKSEGNRLVRKFGSLNLYLDFLTEAPPSVSGSFVTYFSSPPIAPAPYSVPCGPRSNSMWLRSSSPMSSESCEPDP